MYSFTIFSTNFTGCNNVSYSNAHTSLICVMISISEGYPTQGECISQIPVRDGNVNPDAVKPVQFGPVCTLGCLGQSDVL